MSDTDGKKPLGLGGAPRSGSVKQSFSHGRTHAVVVETKRKRCFGNGHCLGKTVKDAADLARTFFFENPQGICRRLARVDNQRLAGFPCGTDVGAKPVALPFQIAFEAIVIQPGFPDGNLEMDFYGGYKTSFGDVGLDFGAIYYYYPGSEAKVLGLGANSGAVNNKEVYIGATWKFLSVKYFYSFDDYFSLRGVNSASLPVNKDTKGSSYLDFGATYDLGDGWGINGHVGLMNLENVKNGDYTDWKIGVTKDINGWVFGVAYIDTNADGDCKGATTYQPYCFTNSNSDNGAGGINVGSNTKDAGRGIGVVSVSKSF